MDWSNERYVRIYTRDSITWKRLGWKGQTVLMHTARKLDRSGVLDLNGVDAAAAINLITDLPLEIIDVGLPICLELGVFEVDDGRLLMPNFLEAQEAVASNAERQRRWRAKKRTGNSYNETSTPSNETSTDRNERNVTRNENNPVLNQPCLTSLTNQLPDSSESVSAQIDRLSERYDLEAELLSETRESCALNRKNGKMSDGVWLRLLQKLYKHPIESVLSAMSIFTEKHADGDKSENYLMGIVRGESKRLGGTRRPKREKPQEVRDAERILSTATPTYPSDEEKVRLNEIINKWKEQQRRP